MIKNISLTLAVTLALVGLPFLGGSGPSPFYPESNAAEMSGNAAFVAATSPQKVLPTVAVKDFEVKKSSPVIVITNSTMPTVDTEHLAQKPVPIPVVVPPTVGKKSSGKSSGAVVGAQRRAAVAAAGGTCPGSNGGGGSAPGVSDPQGQGMISGTTSGDIQSFSSRYNAIRAENCLDSIPAGNFRYDSCMEQRLFWIAEDPSTDPNSAWGHIGSVRSDGVPSVGCDGNLAGGSGNSGTTVAQKWWDSTEHRLSLYRPSFAGSTSGVCIYFAMVHGGIPNEPSSFTRAAARWGSC